MSIQTLASDLKKVMAERIEKEGRAMRGTIREGKLQVGNEQYDLFQAVECEVSEGSRVWAMRARNGKAVIVGS